MQKLESDKEEQLREVHAEREAEKARVRAKQAAAERAREGARLHQSMLGDEVSRLEAEAEVDRKRLDVDAIERAAREAAEEAFELGRTVIGRQLVLHQAEDERQQHDNNYPNQYKKVQFQLENLEKIVP